MKKVISIILLSVMFGQVAFADCDFSKGITPGPNNTFIYSEECHQKVGNLVQQNQNQQQQIDDLNKAIQLKDLALKASDDRANSWSQTSAALENRLQTVDQEEKKNQWLYFGLGVAVTFLAGYGAAKLAGR